jgi:hypothetical protein
MIIIEATIPIKQKQQQSTKPNVKAKRKKEKTVSFDKLLDMAMGKN